MTTGEQSNEWIEITSPELPPNTLVATSGQRLLSEGLAVAVRNNDESSSIANAADENLKRENR